MAAILLAVSLPAALSAEPLAAEAAAPGEPAERATAAALYLGLKEAVLLSVGNNPDLRAAGFLPLKAAGEVSSVEGKNDPIAYTKGTYTDTEYPTTTPTITGTTQKLFSASLGWKQYLTTGTYYDFAWNSSYSESDFSLSTLNPSYRTDFSFAVTQPLLKGFGLAVNRAPAEIARDAKEAAEIQFRGQTEDLVQKVTETYWDLVLAREIATVKTSSLELARNLAASIQKQVASGLLAPLELYKAQAVEATRQEEVLLAGKGVKDVEDVLRSLIAAPGNSAIWDQDVFPVDRPEETDIRIEEKQDLERALGARDEIRQAEADRKAKIEALRVAANALLPSLNLLGGMRLNGLSGRGVPSSLEKSCAETADPRKCEENLAKIFELFGFTVTGPEPQFLGDYFTAFENLEFLTWYVGFSIEYPLGNNTARAKYDGALMDLDRSTSLLTSLKDKIRLDVREGARRVETNRQRLATTAAASRFAERSLRDEQRKFDEGYSTSTQVLTAQKDLAETRSAELRARADYAKASLRYKAATGTLLEDAGIEPRLPTVAHFDTPGALW